MAGGGYVNVLCEGQGSAGSVNRLTLLVIIFGGRFFYLAFRFWGVGCVCCHSLIFNCSGTLALRGGFSGPWSWDLDFMRGILEAQGRKSGRGVGEEELISNLDLG